ncbi:hypothetical protein LINPERPRIM_LOCUS37631 [Linum perenne]
MNNSQNTSYEAGQAKGQVQEKASGMMEKAGNVAQSTKESLQEVCVIIIKNLFIYNLFIEKLTL